MARKKRDGRSSLAYQMRESINQNFSEGKSKRAAKMSEGGRGASVYSYSHRKSLIEFSTQFANYCKSEFGVKNVKDVTREHAQAFLNEKAKTCSDTTLKTYHQHLNKIDKCFKSSYKSYKSDLTQGVVIPAGTNQTKLRDVKISRESMNKVLDKLDMRHATHRAIACAEALGLRASESAKIKGEHINLEKGVVSVVGKGGRYREVKIPEDRQGVLSSIKEMCGDGRIAPVKTDSVNVTFNRICEREGIDDLEGTKSGIHAVRKLWATELYEEKLGEGMSEKEAWGDVSEELGHGRDRPDLFKTYIVG